MNLQQFVQRHPLAAFFTWFVAVGQTLAFVPVLTDLPPEPFLIAATFVGLLLPAVAITRIVDGPEALRILRRQTFRVRVPAWWWVFGVVAVPVVTAAVAVAVTGTPPAVTASVLASAVTTGYVISLAVVLVTVNLWEEVAWMGFVQARLQRRHGAMRSAVVTGVAFGLGHISLAFSDGMSAAVTLTALLLAVSIPFRALQGWIYNRTDSLLVVGLVHAAANAVAVGSVLGAGLLPRLYGDDSSSGLVFPVLAVIGLVVIFATRARLGYPPARPRPTAPPRPPAPIQASPDRGTPDVVAS